MGNLTTIIFHNDAFHDFKENKDETVDNILEAMQTRKYKTFGVGNHSNPMKSMGTSHADESRLYLQNGNTLFEIGYKTDIQDIKYRKQMVKLAKELIRAEERAIKEIENSAWKKHFERHWK